jgi:hypothetical protein
VTVNDELERILEEVVMVYLKQYPCISIKGLR